MKCPVCNTENNVGSLFCKKCHYDFLLTPNAPGPELKSFFRQKIAHFKKQLEAREQSVMLKQELENRKEQLLEVKEAQKALEANHNLLVEEKEGFDKKLSSQKRRADQLETSLQQLKTMSTSHEGIDYDIEYKLSPAGNIIFTCSPPYDDKRPIVLLIFLKRGRACESRYDMDIALRHQVRFKGSRKQWIYRWPKDITLEGRYYILVESFAENSNYHVSPVGFQALEIDFDQKKL